MRNLTLYVLLFGLLVLFYLGWRANPERASDDPVAEDAAFVVGEWIYGRDCASCHTGGTHSFGIGGFEGNQADFESILRAGPTPMPSFDGVYTEQERDALWAYVQTLGS